MHERISRFAVVLLAICSVMMAGTALFAGTTGKISGVITDKASGAKLPGVNVAVVGTKLGAVTDLDGEYFIINIPPGTYSVRATIVGYTPIEQANAIVNVDVTTPLNFSLSPTAVEVKEPVIVTAERPLVEKTRTDTKTIVKGSDIISAPITSVGQLVNTVAGVYSGYIRGAHAKHNITLLDGASVSDIRNSGSQVLSINPYMIEEVEVKSGTFNAEYQALGGIINVVTKEGGKKFSGNLRYYSTTGGLEHKTSPPLYLTSKDKWVDRTSIYWDYAQQDDIGFSYITKMAGKVKNTYTPDKYGHYQKNGTPDPNDPSMIPQDPEKTDKPTRNFEYGVGGPLGDKVSWFNSGQVSESFGRWPGDYSRIVNTFGKLTMHPSSSTKLSVSGMVEDQGYFSRKAQTGFSWGWKYYLEGLSKSYTGRFQLGTDWDHALSSKTYYKIRVNHLSQLTDVYNPKYGLTVPVQANPLSAGSSAVAYLYDSDDATGANANAFQKIRDRATTFDAEITSQVTFHHQVKSGLRLVRNDLSILQKTNSFFGFVGYIDSLDIKPIDAALYIQDRMEYGSLIVNLGIRGDIFNPSAKQISPWRPFAPIKAGTAVSNPGSVVYNRVIPTKVKMVISPRIGVSHPISDRVSLHYAYGLFAQRPTFGELYQQFNQNNTQGPGPGNPDLPYQTATIYEAGTQFQVSQDYLFDITGYQRDVRNLAASVRYEPDQTNPGILYNRGYELQRLFSFVPLAYADSRGLEFTLNKRMSHHFSFRGSYTVSWANLGDKSSPEAQSILLDQAAHRLPEILSQPTSWDRRNIIVADFNFDIPVEKHSLLVGTVTRAQSGIAFKTRQDLSQDPYNRRRISQNLPWTTETDLRAEFVLKAAKGSSFKPSFFIDIRNLFNRTNIYSIADAEFYRSTRDQEEKGVVIKGQKVEADPTGPAGNPQGVYGAPRDIYLGVSANW